MSRSHVRSSSGSRFGILVPAAELTWWQRDVLRQLLALDGASLELVVVHGHYINSPCASSCTRPPSSLQSLIAPDSLFRLYQRLNRPPAAQMVDAMKELQGSRVLSCSPVRIGRSSIYFKHGDVQEIEAYDLDFLLLLGFAPIRGEILTVPRYGVWSFQFGEVERCGRGPPYYWKIVHGEPVMAAILQRITAGSAGGIVLREGFFKTVPESYRKSLEKVLSSVTRWPAQVCVDLANGRAGYLDGPAADRHDTGYTSPTNSEAFLGILKIAANWLKAKTRVLFRHEGWNVGVIEQPLNSLLSHDEDLAINWAPSSGRNRFLADPFGIETERGCQILVEEYEYCRGKGKISALTYDSGRFLPVSNSVMESEFHHAYPFVFHLEGELFCTPERRGSKELAIYKATNYPTGWERVGTLIEGVDVVDPTLFQWKGQWWLACTGAGFNASRDLSFWYSDQLLGTWRPHANNPVKTDVRNARPAGTPFAWKGSLYRPAQDSSRTYGGRVVINEVTELTSESFREKAVKVIGPREGNSPYPEGLHTLAAAGSMTLVDGKRMMFSPCKLRNAIDYWMRKRFPGLEVS